VAGREESAVSAKRVGVSLARNRAVRNAVGAAAKRRHPEETQWINWRSYDWNAWELTIDWEAEYGSLSEKLRCSVRSWPGILTSTSPSGRRCFGLE